MSSPLTYRVNHSSMEAGRDGVDGQHDRPRVTVVDLIGLHGGVRKLGRRCMKITALRLGSQTYDDIIIHQQHVHAKLADANKHSLTFARFFRDLCFGSLEAEDDDADCGVKGDSASPSAFLVGVGIGVAGDGGGVFGDGGVIRAPSSGVVRPASSSEGLFTASTCVSKLHETRSTTRRAYTRHSATTAMQIIESHVHLR